MPIYDYHCEECGDFTLRRPMSQSAASAPCPLCLSDANRLITAPFLASMNPHTRIAYARNEKSADSPAVMSREQLDHAGRPRAHVHDHAPRLDPKMMARAGVGKDWIRSDRASMIGH
jgi:putative FmdB family regulatory protein